jgi:predicted lysophospholipase L1 biosynthesis ABC-type transport system permease subunit
MADFWSSDYSAADMPQEYVQRLAQAETLTLATHIVATLQSKITWRDRSVLLVGYAKETTQPHRSPKEPMGYAIEPGTVFVGHELGHGLEEGQTIEVLGRAFRIAEILPERGSKEDITLAVSLGDAQALLDKPGRVNQILALGCRCEGARLPKVREQLEEVLPETRITEFQSIALARAEQRNLVEEKNRESIALARRNREEVQATMRNLDAVTTPLVILACAIWVGLLASANVRERRNEIGVLRALGVRSGTIAILFLGKAVAIGALGGVLGFLLGTPLARALGRIDTLAVDRAFFTPAYELLLLAALGAPLLSAMASYLPTLNALLQDPAAVLTEE